MATHVVSYGAVVSNQYVAGNAAWDILDIAGGTATNTSVGNGGVVNVGNGGVPTNIGGYLISTRISSGGAVYLIRNQGALAKVVSILAGGKMEVQSMTTISSASVSSKGFLYISSGGTLENVSVSYGGHINEFTIAVLGGNSYTSHVNVSHAIVSDGHNATLYYLQTAYDVAVLSGGSMTVEERATASSVVLSAGASATVKENAGLITDVSVAKQAVIHAVSGGIIDSVSLFGSGNVSGGIGRNIAVHSGGSLTVQRYELGDNLVNGLVTDVTLENGTVMKVSRGGIAVSATVNSGASAVVLSEGMISSGIVHGYANLAVSGGTAKDTYISANGNVVVNSNGITSNTRILLGGNLVVRNYGSSLNDTILNLGTLSVSNGGTAQNTNINAGGVLNVSNGGLAVSATVNSGGKLQINNGGIVSGTKIESSGIVSIAAGGSTVAALVKNNATLTLTSGATGISTTISSGGTLYINAGGIHKGSITINAGAEVSVVNGAIFDFDLKALTVDPERRAMINDLSRVTGANNENFTITVTKNQAEGVYTLAENAIATGIFGIGSTVKLKIEGMDDRFISINESESLKVDFDDDGITDYQYKLMLNTNGTLSFAAGDIEDPVNPTLEMEETIVDNIVDSVIVSAAFGVETYGMRYCSLDNVHWNLYTEPIVVRTNHTTLYFKGQDTFGLETEVVSCYISSIIRKSLVNIYVGGTIVDGKIPTDTILKDSYIEKNGYIAAGTPDSMTNVEVLAGGKLTSAEININAGLWVKGGNAKGIAVNGSGYMEVNNNGYAENVSIDSSAKLHVCGGGIVNSVSIQSKGYLEVNSNGSIINGTIHAGGSLDVRENGYLNTIAVSGFQNDTGILRVFTGGRADKVSVHSRGRLCVSNGGVAVDATVYNLGEVIVASGGHVSGITLNNMGQAKVLAAGAVSNAIINNGGTLLVTSGGLTNIVYVTEGGHLKIEENAICWNTRVLAGGQVSVSAGASACTNDIFESGAILLSAGGVANWTTIHQNGGLHVYSGGQANSTTVMKGGYLGVGYGGNANTIKMNDLSQLTVWSGGTIYDTNIGTWAAVILSNGAVAKGNAINACGGLHVYSGAVAEDNAVAASAFLGVGDGGIIRNTYIDNNGSLTIWSGGEANNTRIASNGNFILSCGAAANYTTVTEGAGFHVYAGATTKNTVVTAGAFMGLGGRVGFDTGATLIDSEVEYDGTLVCYSGANMRGLLNFAGYVEVLGNVNAMDSTICFDLTERSSADTVIVSDISKLFGASFFITIDSDMQSGTYLLAGNAGNFTDMIALSNSTARLAVGSTIQKDGMSLTLGRDGNNNLYLDIASLASGAAEVDWEESSLGSWDNELAAGAAAELAGKEENPFLKSLAIA